MPTPLDSGIGNLWMAKQTALGTIAATAAASSVQGRWVSGSLRAGKALGSEEFLDGNRWGSPQLYTDKIGGEVGSPTFQAGYNSHTGSVWGWLLGIDVVSGAADPYTHTLTSAGTAGAYLTARQKVGSAVGPSRQAYWDAKISKLMFEIGQDQNVGHLTPTLMALTAAEVGSLTDPVAAIDAADSMVWAEVTGAVTFDSVALGEAHGEVVELDTNMESYYGDNVLPMALIEGKGTVQRTVRTIVTDATLALFNKAIYNTATPSIGTKPVAAVYNAACTTIYTRSATRKITITTPKIAVTADNMTVAPSPTGGKIDLEFSGQCLSTAGTPALTVIMLTGDAASYA